MNCPNCNHICEESDLFCTQCGARLGEEVVSEPVFTPPAPKKGSHWVPLLLLALISVIGIVAYFALPGPGNTAQASSIPWFTLENGTLYFEEARYNGEPELTIPAEIDGEPVLEIGPGCFKDCTELTTVFLPDTVTGIAGEAFMGCTNLRGIFIPDGVVYISDAAFVNCSSLEAISIPSSVSSIGYRAFSGCDKLWYIFYDGNHEEWVELFDEFITPFTGVFCKDGSFYQGSKPFE